MGVDKSVENYCGAALEDGTMIVRINRESFYSNIGQTGDKRFLGSLASDSGLSLKTTMDIEKSQEKRDGILAELQDTLQLGMDVTLDIEWSEMAEAAEKRGYKDRAGEVITAYLEQLSKNMKGHAKDETVLETIASCWSTGVVKVELVDKSVQNYCGAI